MLYKHAVKLPMQTSLTASESSSCYLQSCLAAAVSCQACLMAEAKQASRTRRTGKAGSKLWSCSLIASVCLWKRWCASPRPLPWSRRKSLLSLRCAASAYPIPSSGQLTQQMLTTPWGTVCCTTPVRSSGSQISLSFCLSSYLYSMTSRQAQDRCYYCSCTEDLIVELCSCQQQLKTLVWLNHCQSRKARACALCSLL